MAEPQITGETVGEVRPVADMHQRKAEMARHSDCFIALPGPIFLFHSPANINIFRPTLYPYVPQVISGILCNHLGFRWVWNTGGAIGGHHLGSTGHPQQACKQTMYSQVLLGPCLPNPNSSISNLCRWGCWMSMATTTTFSLSLTKPWMMASSSRPSATS